MRIAVLADAHGNLLALQAVLADLRAQAPDLVVNLEDLVTRGRAGAWSAKLRAVAYDWDGAARQAMGHNHPNTARWVATGRA